MLHRRQLLLTGAAVPWLAQARDVPRAPARHALLIGVSALALQPRSAWLRGPQADVEALRRVLPAHGFAGDRIQVLADGVAGSVAPAPTRAVLLAALQGLGARLAPGDTVLLYWSGHGVRVAGPAKAVAEPDGLLTCLLAHDAARLRGSTPWPLQGAVADAEVGACIDDWLARGAHVLAVFDTCYAASATRAAPPGLAWRGLRAADLALLRPTGAPPSAAAQLPARLRAPRARPEGYVGLFACEGLQRTPEWRAADGAVRGLFTAALCAALDPARGSPPTDYAALARAVLAQYPALAGAAGLPRSTWPSPRFEGSLQAPLWTRGPATATALDTGAQAAAALPAGVRVTVHCAPPGLPAQAWDASAAPRLMLGPLPAGTALTLRLDNASGQALDVLLVHRPPTGAATVLHPALAGDSPRLDAGTPAAPARLERRFVLQGPESAAESLVLQIAPVAPQALPRAIDPAPPAAWQAQVHWRVVGGHG